MTNVERVFLPSHLNRFGFYYILPLTAPTVLTTPDPTIPPSTIKPRAQVCTLVIGDYNVCPPSRVRHFAF